MHDNTKNITEIVARSQCVFHSARFDVRSLELKPQTTRDFVAHPGAVVVLPLLDEQRVVMIRNQRYAVGQELWELPAGLREPNEQPEATAARELIEETGYRAEKVEPLLNFFTSPGFCNELMYAYAAYQLQFVGQALEENEKIRVEVLSWTEILGLLKKGAIIDAKTVATLLYYHTFLGS